MNGARIERLGIVRACDYEGALAEPMERFQLAEQQQRRLIVWQEEPGHLCVHRVVPGKGRCRTHGGLSPGPKTAAGMGAHPRGTESPPVGSGSGSSIDTTLCLC